MIKRQLNGARRSLYILKCSSKNRKSRLGRTLFPEVVVTFDSQGSFNSILPFLGSTPDEGGILKKRALSSLSDHYSCVPRTVALSKTRVVGFFSLFFPNYPLTRTHSFLVYLKPASSQVQSLLKARPHNQSKNEVSSSFFAQSVGAILVK